MQLRSQILQQRKKSLTKCNFITFFLNEKAMSRRSVGGDRQMIMKIIKCTIHNVQYYLVS